MAGLACYAWQDVHGNAHILSNTFRLAVSDAGASKPKRWWDTDKGKENIKKAAGEGRRAADNTYMVERKMDDFESLGLLDDDGPQE